MLFGDVFSDHNVWAIIVLSVGFVLFGALWYSPKVFGGTWMECAHVGEDQMKNGCSKCYIMSFISALVMIFVLSLFIRTLGVQTFWEGAVVAFWAWLGFVATTYFGGVIWEKMHLKSFFIHALFMGVSLFIIGGFLGVW